MQPLPALVTACDKLILHIPGGEHSLTLVAVAKPSRPPRVTR